MPWTPKPGTAQRAAPPESRRRGDRSDDQASVLGHDGRKREGPSRNWVPSWCAVHNTGDEGPVTYNKAPSRNPRVVSCLNPSILHGCLSFFVRLADATSLDDARRAGSNSTGWTLNEKSRCLPLVRWRRRSRARLACR